VLEVTTIMDLTMDLLMVRIMDQTMDLIMDQTMDPIMGIKMTMAMPIMFTQTISISLRVIGREELMNATVCLLPIVPNKVL
jgi:hypothetical protein